MRKLQTDQRKTHFAGGLALIGWLFVSGCARTNDPPSRDHIPLIKAQVMRLQSAIQESNRAAIDSLASVALLENLQSSDSLLRLVYGFDGSYPFGRLADVSIAYTLNRARVDCRIVDTANKQQRPLVLTFALVDSTWLLKRFDTDTTGMPTGRIPDTTGK